MTERATDLLARLQRWIRRGWVDEQNSLGDYENGRRSKRRRYKTFGGVTVHDLECGPTPALKTMHALGAALLREGLDDDEPPWPPEQLNPISSLDQLLIAVHMESKADPLAFGRYARLLTVERWQKAGKIIITPFCDGKTAVRYGAQLREELSAVFPTEEMVANIALAIGAGAC